MGVSVCPFSDGDNVDPKRVIPYSLTDCLERVDWSGRAIVDGKRGRIPDDLPPVLQRLKVNPGNYIRFIRREQKHRFHAFIGSVEAMRDAAERFGRSFLKGQTAAAPPFSPG